MVRDRPTVTTVMETVSPVGPDLLGTAPPGLPREDAAGTAPVLTPRLVPDASKPTGKLQGAIYVYGPLARDPTPTAGTMDTYNAHSFRVVFYRVASSFPIPREVFRATQDNVRARPGAEFEGGGEGVRTVVGDVWGTANHFVCCFSVWTVRGVPINNQAGTTSREFRSGLPGRLPIL